jgi:Protein of unknown function (DUF4229)
MRNGLAYTSARILLLVVAFGLLRLAGVRGWALLALAFLVSALASYVLLSKQRDVMSAAIARRFGKSSGRPRRPRLLRWHGLAEFRARLEEGTRAEDSPEAAPARETQDVTPS